MVYHGNPVEFSHEEGVGHVLMFSCRAAHPHHSLQSSLQISSYPTAKFWLEMEDRGLERTASKAFRPRWKDKRLNEPNGEEIPEGTRKAKTRRISPAGRTDDEQGSGDLDLNATPLGFDLNAPVEDEEILQGGSGWLSPQEEVESKHELPDTAETKTLPLEAVLPQVRAKSEPLPEAESAQAAPTVQYEEVHEPQKSIPEQGTGIAQISPKEEHESDQGESPSVKEEELDEQEEKAAVNIPAVFRRPFEHPTASNFDEDLDILKSVWSAWQQEDAEALDHTLADALEEVGKHPQSPSRYLLLSCMYVSKKLPEAFNLPRTLKVLLTFLESGATQPVAKRQSMLPVLACKFIFRAFAGEPDWPIEFVQVYLLDSVGTRAWVEHEGCKEFVTNLLTAFPGADLDVAMSSEDTISTRPPDLQGGSGDLQQGQGVKLEAQGMAAVTSRYLGEEVQQRVRKEFFDTLNPLLGAASSKENPRHLLRLLMQGAGFEEVRVVGSSMLESWLNSPVHLRAAKSLLDRILQHTRGTSENDFNTVANLLALRVSSTQAPGQIKTIHNNIFSEMISQLVRRRPEYATLALKTFVTAELQSKNPHNMKSITTVLKAMPSDETPPEHELALILQELAASDESRGLLQDFVRRMTKQAGGEFEVHQLCLGLMQPWQLMAEQDDLLKEAWLDQLVDLTCQLLLHAAAPFVEDETLFSAIISSSNRSSTVSGPFGSSIGLERSTSGATFKERLLNLEKFSLEIQHFQMMAMAWCTDVLAVYLPSIEGTHFRKIVRQLLFLEESEAYFTYADSPGVVELNYIRLLGACTRAPEEIVARLILMGISNFPVTPAEALDIIEVLVCRAAKLQEHMEGSLVAASIQLPAAIFKLASFNLPGVTRQPETQLVLKGMYWQACLVVLIIAVFNPKTIGYFVWESIPALRTFMEALIKGSGSFLPDGVFESRKVELEKMEGDAEQLDNKAEDAIFKFLAEKRRTESGGFEGDEFASSDIEWNGTVMLFNQSGPGRRPPQSLHDKLHHYNEMFKLGHVLRRCRSPDFLSEVTALQTLQQAWPWLQKLLSREPEVVDYLPPAWQCEVLYMLEGSHTTKRKLSVDLSKLRANLRQVIFQNIPSKGNELESVVLFLSHKLAAKSSAARSHARRCLAGLFQTPTQLSEPQTSVPSSPRDCRRTESTLGGINRWPGASTETSLSHHPKKSMGGISGPSSAHASPGISPGLASSRLNVERTRPVSQSSTKEEDTAWLDLLETLPTAARLISAFLPAIRLAIQQETSTRVVVAYLNFLKKHAPPLPSWQSMACSLAVFVSQRKLLTASLLAGPPTIPSAFSHDTLRFITHVGTVDLILDSVCEALEVGTDSEASREEHYHTTSPVVTFASPRYLGNEEVVIRVKLHKVVLDASLEVLSLLALNDNEGYRERPQFMKLVGFFCPDTQFPMAWLEGSNGEKRPLLSEEQAVLFARSKVPKLIRAGLAALSLGPKLDLCEKLGLCPVAAAALLQDLDTVPQARLESMLGSRVNAGRRAMKLKKCVHGLMQLGSPCGSQFFRMLEICAAWATHGEAQQQMRTPPLRQEDVEDDARMEIDSESSLSGEQLAHQVYPFLKQQLMGNTYIHTNCRKNQELTNTAPYVKFRQILQQSLLCSVRSHTMSTASSCVHTLAQLVKRGQEGSVQLTEQTLLALPVLCVLSKIQNGGFQKELQRLVFWVQHGIESGLRAGSLSQSSESDMLLTQILLILRDFLRPLDGSSGSETASDNSSGDSVENSTMQKLLGVPLPRLEGLLRSFLRKRLNALWENKNDNAREMSKEMVDQGNLKEPLVLELVDLLRVHIRKQASLHFVGFREQVEGTGWCALVTEFLGFLDPECESTSHFTSLFESSRLWKEKTSFSLLNLALNSVIHRSSWTTIARICKVMLEVCLTPKCEVEGNKYKKESDEKFKNVDLVQTGPKRFQVLGEAGVVLEYVSCCIQHPRTVLSCRLDEELDPFERSTEAVLSSIPPDSAQALTILAVADLATVGLVNDSLPFSSVNNTPERSSSAAASRALRVLMVAACQGSTILSTIVEQLKALEQEKEADTFLLSEVKPGLKDTITIAASGAAGKLLSGLYQAFPVSLRAIWNGSKGQKSSTPDLPLSTEEHSAMERRFGQTCALNSLLHSALRSVCNGSEKEAKSAYGFCHDMARQHPSLVIPHLPTLTVLLKELLPLVKQQDSQVRTMVARAYSLGIGLLDALRPRILTSHETNSSSPPKPTSLEIILGFYFEFLQCLDVQDRPHFAKVVARLADFLCHCVNAGGFYRDFVSSHRIPILQYTAQTFGKIKKLGFLLGMLDKPMEAFSTLKSKGAQEEKTVMVGGSLGPPSLPLEDVLKVRRQLLQCIGWQGPGTLRDAGSGLFGRGIKSRSFRYEIKGLEVEEVNLVATLSDLERASARMPAILSVLEDSLLELTHVSDPNVRDRAYGLLERLLLHCPSEGSSANIVQVLHQQLSSSDTSLAKTAARQASRFFYYCSEFQESMLVEMLQVGRFAMDDLKQLLQGLFTVASSSS